MRKPKRPALEQIEIPTAERRVTPLTNYERETIIRFNDDEDFAIVDTMNRRWIRSMEKSGFVAYAEDEHGGKKFEIPKARVMVPRQPRIVSDEQREISRQRMAQMHQKTADA